MFVRVKTRTHNGVKYSYAELVENKKVDGKVVQKIIRNLGKVTPDQVPYLKAAYMPADKRPILVYKDKEN